MPFVVAAVTLRFAPPMSVPSIAAVVTSSMIATATEAPTPTEPAPLTPVVPSAGSAVVLVVESDAARDVDVAAVRVDARAAGIDRGRRGC